MCTGLEIAALASAAVGTAATVYGQVEAGNERKAAAEFNAREAENQAAYAQDEAAQRAANIRKAARSQASSADAQLAASGVKIGEGSSIDISRTIYQQSEVDAYNTIANGRRGSQAGSDQATLLRAGGNNAQTDAYIGAGATILGSASKVASGWRGTARAGSGYSDFVKGYTPENYG